MRLENPWAEGLSPKSGHERWPGFVSPLWHNQRVIWRSGVRPRIDTQSADVYPGHDAGLESSRV